MKAREQKKKDWTDVTTDIGMLVCSALGLVTPKLTKAEAHGLTCESESPADLGKADSGNVCARGPYGRPGGNAL